MLRYSVVGGTGAVVDLGVLYILTEFFNFYYLLSTTLSFSISALLNFYFNRRWTFKSTGNPKRQLLIFSFVAVSGVLLNVAIMYILVELFNIYYMLAKVGSIAVVTIWNFLWNKYFTFGVK
jgi:putative flippase GtrA